jgi:hypothetical protein
MLHKHVTKQAAARADRYWYQPKPILDGTASPAMTHFSFFGCGVAALLLLPGSEVRLAPHF